MKKWFEAFKFVIIFISCAYTAGLGFTYGQIKMMQRMDVTYSMVIVSNEKAQAVYDEVTKP